MATIKVALCSSSSSEVLLLLRPASLVLLLLHVLASHPLSPLRQPAAARAVFTWTKTAAVVTGVAFFAALALVELEGEDDVFVIAAELAHKALGLAQHTASYVQGA